MESDRDNLNTNLKSEAEQQWTEVTATCFSSFYVSFFMSTGDISEFNLANVCKALSQALCVLFLFLSSTCHLSVSLRASPEAESLSDPQ